MDLNQIAFRIIKLATEPAEKRTTEAKARAGRLGAASRARSLSDEERRAIALKANDARWNKSVKTDRQPKASNSRRNDHEH